MYQSQLLVHKQTNNKSPAVCNLLFPQCQKQQNGQKLSQHCKQKNQRRGIKLIQPSKIKNQQTINKNHQRHQSQYLTMNLIKQKIYLNEQNVLKNLNAKTSQNPPLTHNQYNQMFVNNFPKNNQTQKFEQYNYYVHSPPISSTLPTPPTLPILNFDNNAKSAILTSNLMETRFSTDGKLSYTISKHNQQVQRGYVTKDLKSSLSNREHLSKQSSYLHKSSITPFNHLQQSNHLLKLSKMQKFKIQTIQSRTVSECQSLTNQEVMIQDESQIQWTYDTGFKSQRSSKQLPY